MDISLEITKLIKDTLKKINIEDANFIVEIPNNKTNGDYSTNVAMELTKKLHKKKIGILLKQFLKTFSFLSPLLFMPIFFQFILYYFIIISPCLNTLISSLVQSITVEDTFEDFTSFSNR